MKENDKLKDLKIDEWIWVVFIILSALNIFGDELEKDYYLHHNTTKDKTAKKIFTLTVFISFLIYCYLAYQRYQRVQIMKTTKKDTKLEELRLFASILVVIASIIFLYYQLEDTSASNPSIV